MTKMFCALVSLAVVAPGCGKKDDDTTGDSTGGGTPAPGRVVVAGGSDDTTGGESASEVALSGASGALADSEGISADLALETPHPGLRLLRGARALFESTAWAVPAACPILSNTTLASCSGGSLTLSFDACQYERLNKTFMPAVWTGSKLLQFGGACPKRLADITTIDRTFGAGSTRTSPNGVVIAIDTIDPSGWDASVTPQPFGGTAITRAAASRSIDIKGLHYVADKSASDATKLWDHTLSTPDPLAVSVDSLSGRTMSGMVIVQHNLAKYTARASFSQVVFDIAQCGCFPVSGTVTSTLSGSRNGTESLTITGCASASYKDENGATSKVTLTSCL